MSAASLPTGWSVELGGLTDTVMFTSPSKTFRLLWADGAWYKSGRVGDGRWMSAPATGIAVATSRTQARAIGTKFVARLAEEYAK